jgi:hypothetical protein
MQINTNNNDKYDHNNYYEEHQEEKEEEEVDPSTQNQDETPCADNSQFDSDDEAARVPGEELVKAIKRTK